MSSNQNITYSLIVCNSGVSNNLIYRIDNTQLSFDNQIYIYPNPANDFVDIIYLNFDTKINYIELCTIFGKQLSYYKIEMNNLKINISTLETGLYLLRTILDNNQKFINRVVKE